MAGLKLPRKLREMAKRLKCFLPNLSTRFGNPQKSTKMPDGHDGLPVIPASEGGHGSPQSKMAKKTRAYQ